MQTFDCDDILYQKLTGSQELSTALSGGIYVQGERPDGSEKEDIVIGTITITESFPQIAVSNVNIHVPDSKLKIKGVEQRKADRERLRTLEAIVLSVLKESIITGLSLWATNSTTIQQPEIKQHYVNLRIEWSIHV